jgi:hypothetical protein
MSRTHRYSVLSLCYNRHVDDRDGTRGEGIWTPIGNTLETMRC